MKFYTSVVQWGNSILVREVEYGTRKNYRVPYSPTLYVPTTKVTGTTNLKKENVAPVEFETIKEAKEFISNYKDQPHLVFGFDKFNYTWISDTYSGLIKYDRSKILIFTIDIEVEAEHGFPVPEKATEPMICISLKNHYNQKIMVWGMKPFKSKNPNVVYKLCSSETDLLLSFVEYWEKFTPDVVTGWNVDGFDIPYLYNRIKNVLGDDVVKKLSPWGVVAGYDKMFRGKKQFRVDILGVSILDYLQLYQKFTYKKQESYKLEYIAQEELGKGKNKNPYKTFKEWYTKDYQGFVEYNIVDVTVVDELDDKLKLLDLAFTLAYYAKINFSDVYSPVRMWDVIIYNFLRDHNIAIPQATNNQKFEAFEGAYVKEPLPGLYGWTVSFDLTSLYPHLIMMYNLSPETKAGTYSQRMSVDTLLSKSNDLDFLKSEKKTVAPNGTKYTTEFRGFLPQLMEDMFDKRKEFKKKMIESKKQYEGTKDSVYSDEVARYDMIQMALKIALNSAYGAVGNAGFRYFDLDIAEAITTGGQLSIRWIEQDFNKYMNKLMKTADVDYIIAADTDSIYINFGPLINLLVAGQILPTDKMVDKVNSICESMKSVITKSYDDLASYVNAYEQKMDMKRECICDTAIWTGKKHYSLSVWDAEGVRYKTPKLKIMGLEAIKSSTPAICRKKLTEGIKLIFDTQNNPNKSQIINEFIQDFKKVFDKLPIDEIASPRGVNGLENYINSTTIYNAGATAHIKGSLIYNHHIKLNKLDKKYEIIKSGERIKYIYLEEPNPINAGVISFPADFPEELDILKYVDLEAQFSATFTVPFALLLNVIGVTIDSSFGDIVSLESFAE